MRQVSIELKDKVYRIYLSDDEIIIFDSYRVRRIKDMVHIIKILRVLVESKPVNSRSMFSVICEWRAHNLLYTLGIKRNHTKDVNLELHPKWYMNIIYPIVGLFYI